MFGTTTTTLSTLATREIELTEQKRGLLTLLKTAEQTAGEALAAAGEAETELSAVIKHKTRLSALDVAIATVRSRRPAVIAEQFAEQARGVRATAENLKRQLSGITTKTSRLLKQLSEIEGVEYTESILCCESAGPNMFHGPKSEALRSEIQTLEAKADDIEARTAAANGYVDIEAATDSAEVTMAALTHASHVPTAESITNWLAACAQNPRVPGRDFGSRARRVRLVWANGVIDTSESYLFVPELARRMESTAAQTIDSFDLPSATFRAAV